ncbi:UNVERIFIED_CONTAM: UDP-glycosyltransferase 73C5 [Sesamum radiatum]|uniref:UDP-glycosyltransferase 73C5 n=1 Tax=Sesamum radiatum TaxID=300843 RepID=A0AAW2QGH3_SESRA
MASKFEQLHFLLDPLMSHSHISPMTDFAKLLARQGVFVSLVTTPLNAIRYKGVIDNAKVQNLKIQMIPIKFPCQEAGLPDGCENVEALTSKESARKFYRACELLIQGPLEQLIQELKPKPSCIVSSHAIPWTLKVAQKFKIPNYIFETVSCFTLLSDHNIRAYLEETVVSDLEPFLVPDIPHKIEFTKAQLPEIMTAKDSDVSDHIKQMIQAVDSARGILMNSFEELEPWYLDGCRKVFGKVWCIGSFSVCKKEASERSDRSNKAFSIDGHYCLAWLDSMKPKSVIYACFGSLCRMSLAQIKEIGLGLEATNFPFIWVIRKQDYSAEVEKWLAEDGLEERVRERIIRGWRVRVSRPPPWNRWVKLMITWPMFAEQFYNERFIVNVLGIGVRVGVEGCVNNSGKSEDLVKWDQVKRAIEDLMDFGSEVGRMRRKRAEEVAKMTSKAAEKGGSSYLN